MKHVVSARIPKDHFGDPGIIQVYIREDKHRSPKRTIQLDSNYRKANRPNIASLEKGFVLPLNERWRLVDDPDQWILQRRKGAHGEEIQDGSIGASSVRAPPFLFQSRNAAWSSPKRRWPPCCGWLASEIGIRACGLSSNSGAATSSESNKRLIRGAQAIADTGFGQNISRTFGIGLDLLPELPNINAQILCVRQRIP